MTSPIVVARPFPGARQSDDRAANGTTEPSRKILHIDMDAFYASVEQREDPSLKGKPVAVGGARERGVVAAASYEARRFGVRSAMASATARRLCPDLVFVKPRFAIYKAVSHEIRAIFADYTPLVEPLSLDEAYLDVTRNLKGIASATHVAEAIRQRIFDETRLTASAGVSYNKFLAKLASDHRKPDGLFVVTPAEGPGFVADLPVARFHGVGPVTAQKMKHFGIVTGEDLRACDEAFLTTHFGKSGGHYYRLARAIDHRPVNPDRARKSFGSETTFSEDLTTVEAMIDGLDPAIRSVWEHCARFGTLGRTVTVKVKYSDFQQVTRSRTLLQPAPGLDDLRAVGRDLLRSVLPLRRSVRLLGLSVSNFAAIDADDFHTRQLTLPL